MNTPPRYQWFRILLSAFVLLATLFMAGAGIYLCNMHLKMPKADKVASTIKFGKTLEVSSDVVGVLVLAFSLMFFVIAGKWFHASFVPQESSIKLGDVYQFLAKRSGQDVPRSELLEYLTKGR